MKKHYPVALIVLMVGVILFFVNQKKEQASTAKKIKPPESVRSASLIEQAKESPGLKKSNLSDAEMKSECRSTIESIETLPFKTLLYDLENQRLKFQADCLFQSKNDIEMLKGFPDVCEKLENGHPSTECIQKLFFYKAVRIHHATFKDDLNSLTTDIIIHKLIGLLVENAFNSADGLKMMREVGAKLYERLPNSESAAKAAAVGYIAVDELSAGEKLEFDKILDGARAQFPENWEIYEMDLIRKKSKSDDDFKNEVGQFYRNHPESSIGSYYMGCVRWSENKVSEAQGFFQSATHLAPNDKRFSDVYQKSLSLKPPEKICVVQIGFNPEQF